MSALGWFWLCTWMGGGGCGEGAEASMRTQAGAESCNMGTTGFSEALTYILPGFGDGRRWLCASKDVRSSERGVVDGRFSHHAKTSARGSSFTHDQPIRKIVENNSHSATRDTISLLQKIASDYL